jgi:predicted RNase H-like nuclease
MNVICGVDGCRSGWLVIFRDLDSGEIFWQICSTAKDIVAGERSPRISAVDIPIGLPDKGARM